MKITMILGSYRKNGNTARILEMIGGHLTRAATEAGEELEIETLAPGRMNIGFCRGCRACFDLGEERCPLKDDFLSTKASLQAADGVIIASPVYVDDVSGSVKNWIDRMAHVCHRPEFAGKAAYLVTTVGSSPSSHALRSLFLAFLTWGFHISGQRGFVTDARMDDQELQARFDRLAEKVAHKLLADIRQGKASRPSFTSLMMFKIYQTVWKKHADSLDTRYWRDKGWTDPGVQFYIPHRTDPVTVFLARLTGAIITRFVS